NFLVPETELLMMNPGFLVPPVRFSDPFKLIQDLQAFELAQERQNKELHSSQRELMKSKICYTKLYDLSPVGYFTIDLQGTILNANLTLAGILSIERSSRLNHHIMDYIVFEDHDIYYRHLKDLSIQVLERESFPWINPAGT
ncbi:MAG: PAS domain-containing protein, partial [Proteobacteria bacterium]|nr:PAS domain-containing protein [Pseudomonadota bacterium]